MADPFAQFMSYSNPARQEELDDLGKELMLLRQAQVAGVQEGFQRPELDQSQVMATAIASLLPVVAGYMMNKEKGGAIGAQAGGLIGTSVLGGLAEEQKQANERNKLLYETRRDEMKDLRASRKELTRQDLEAADDAALKGIGLEADKELQRMKDTAAMDRVGKREEAKSNETIKSNDRLTGTEGERLRRAYSQNQAVRGAGKTIAAADWIGSLLGGGSAVEAGQIATQLSVLAGEVGVKTEGDIARSLPKNLQSEATRIFNYMNGDVRDPLTEKTRAAIAALAVRARASATQRISLAREALRRQAPAIAPFSYRQGPDAINTLIDALGTEYELATPPPHSVRESLTFTPEQVRAKMEQRARDKGLLK